MKNVLFKETNDRILELNCDGVEHYKSVNGRNFDLLFENGYETTKEELLKNVEIKKHKELFGSFVKNYGNKNLCKINGIWLNLTTIKNIIPKRFIVYDHQNKGFFKISNLEKTQFAIIASFHFYEKGIEIGRIIESPKISLERDMLDIVTAR